MFIFVIPSTNLYMSITVRLAQNQVFKSQEDTMVEGWVGAYDDVTVLETN